MDEFYKSKEFESVIKDIFCDNLIAYIGRTVELECEKKGEKSTSSKPQKMKLSETLSSLNKDDKEHPVLINHIVVRKGKYGVVLQRELLPVCGNVPMWMEGISSINKKYVISDVVDGGCAKRD